MSDIVNLNKFRKAKAKAERAVKAEENRARFGRSKQERQARRTEEARNEGLLDGKKLDPEA